MSSHQIVHSIPGRCRLRIDQLADDEEFADLLVRRVRSWEMAIEVRANRAAGSLIVTYDENRIATEAAHRYLEACIGKAERGADDPLWTELADVSGPDAPPEPPETADLIPLVNRWRDLGLPVLSISLVALAAPLELPGVLVGGAVLAAAMPWFNRAIESLFKHHRPNIDVLDSLWMGLHTLQGNYAAPALKTCLVESRRTLRGTAAHSLQERAAAASEIGDRYQDLIAHQIEATPVHDTELGAAQAELLRHAVLPTVLMGGAMFATTGNLGAAIAPFQFDFGSGIPISVSTTLVSALALAVERGVYVRSAGVLEKLARVDTLVLDGIRLDRDRSVSASLGDAIALADSRGLELYLLHDRRPDGEVMAIEAKRLGIPPNRIVSAAHIKMLRSAGKRVAAIGDWELGPGWRRGSRRSAIAPADVWVSAARSDWTAEDVTKSSFDLVLLNGDWRLLPEAISMAKKAFERVYENTAIIVFPNLIVTFAAIFLGLNPMINVIVNNGSAFVAEFVNGKRPLFEGRPTAPRNGVSELAVSQARSAVLSFS